VTQIGCSKSSGSSANALNLKIVRGSTSIHTFVDSFMYTNVAEVLYGGVATGIYLDSPATTSAVTYKTQMWNDLAASAVTVQTSNEASQIILMEVL
jgi:hypothetical protein